MQKYNAVLVKDEEQIQFALQIVKEHRKCYPDCKKTTLLEADIIQPDKIKVLALI